MATHDQGAVSSWNEDRLSECLRRSTATIMKLQAFQSQSDEFNMKAREFLRIATEHNREIARRLDHDGGRIGGGD